MMRGFHPEPGAVISAPLFLFLGGLYLFSVCCLSCKGSLGNFFCIIPFTLFGEGNGSECIF